MLLSLPEMNMSCRELLVTRGLTPIAPKRNAPVTSVPAVGRRSVASENDELGEPRRSITRTLVHTTRSLAAAPKRPVERMKFVVPWRVKLDGAAAKVELP